jgi:hypothetical protein
MVLRRKFVIDIFFKVMISGAISISDKVLLYHQPKYLNLFEKNNQEMEEQEESYTSMCYHLRKSAVTINTLENNCG